MLAGRLYAYAFCQDLILLYPLYALLFAETGLTTAQISSLFVIWSVASLTIEIPSGVLADVVSRRLLLVLGPLLTGAGFALWIALPSYPAFALGFVLWGAGSAFQSGAREALVYEELDRHGEASRYARLIGRSAAASTVAVAMGIVAAGPAFDAGGYWLVGVASILACAASAAIGATFPEHRDNKIPDPDTGFRSYTATLGLGVNEIRTQRPVRSAVLFLIAISAIWGSLEEYVGLLAADTGVETAEVPMLILAVYLGIAIGGLLGGVGRRLSRRTLAVLLVLAAAALAAGALAGNPPGFMLIGLAFCVFQMAEIVANTRLQDAITGPARSTVTSAAGLGTDVAGIGVYAIYAAASTAADHSAIFAGWAAAYVVIALLLGARPQGRHFASRGG
ncbi:MFS transporter [Phytoactinopolyspora mesophila]|uniref:MFS transporter n=1 Tax=Phytoactinopolyspora mesophila TaxID=2650750 RepID=A0A7K3LXR2_9ACTN|nr:MFS transporter [Phytoactinopolyspora mesophila]NDL55816.1 MFS transporter [Phytoactinopolyspora mesophila]